MSLNAVKMLGISITTDSKERILEEIEKYLEKSGKKSIKPLVIFTPNTEQLVLAQRNSHFANILNWADVTIPDSGGIVWASKILTKKTLERPIHGVDFMEELSAVVFKRGYRMGLIGGRKGVAVASLECLRQKYEGLTGWAEDGPSIYIQRSLLKMQKINIDMYFSELAKRIIATNTRIVFVGLGAPKQEFFIEKLSDRLSNKQVVLMAVGGSFDLISGRIPRAPHRVQRAKVPFFMSLIGFEWGWRLIHEPWRIGRQLALLKFMWIVCKERFNSKETNSQR